MMATSLMTAQGTHCLIMHKNDIDDVYNVASKQTNQPPFFARVNVGKVAMLQPIQYLVGPTALVTHCHAGFNK